MELGNFYCQIYFKIGSGVSLTTQGALTTALSSWDNMFGTEANASINEEKGKNIELTTGDFVQLSEVLNGQMNFLECTEANYAYLRTTYNKKTCSIIMNAVNADGSGIAVQAKNVIPNIMRSWKSGDLVRIAITFKIESSVNEFEIKELPAA
jgi:hypothetical protein